MRNRIINTDFNDICIECSGQRQGLYQHTSHNVKKKKTSVRCLDSVNNDAVDGGLKISLRMTHIFSFTKQSQHAF